jgi:cell division protein FtsN
MARRKRKSDEAPGWVWMLFGLGIGLIIALGVYMNREPTENAAATQQTPLPEPPPVEPVAQPTVAAQPEPETGTSLIDDAPAADESATRSQPESGPESEAGGEDPQRFGFFEFLESFEVVVPEFETPQSEPEQIAAIEDPGTYVLQAGSFLTEVDADAQRARIALLGVESRIQRVSIDERRFHRVRIGPIEDLENLNLIRTRLAGAGIESIVMRLNE